MYARQESIHIEAPPEVGFDYLADVSRHDEWAAKSLVIRREPGPERGPGVRFTSRVSTLGENVGCGVVIEADRPRRFVYHGEDRTGTWRWTMSFQPETAGTRLTHGFECLRAPVWFRLSQGLIDRFARRPGMVRGLANIKARLENRADAR